MAMAEEQIATKWTLGDLADFESLLAREDAEQGAKRIYRETIAPQLASSLDEGERRRQGLRLWLEAKREGDSPVGQRLEGGLRLTGILTRMIALLFGIGIVRGLLLELPVGEGRGYNIWLFLAVTLGTQWLFLIAGGLSWLCFRKKNRLTWSQELLGILGRKLAGSRVADLWSRLLKMRGDGYGSILGWRLAALSQLGAAWLNIGLVVGLLAMLFVFSLSFYWESTLESFSEQQLVNVTNGLSLPWAWAGESWRPGASGVERTSLEGLANPAVSPAEAVSQVWMRFFVLAILVWGLLPRILLKGYCAASERRSLRGLEFQEPRHRNLWRDMVKTERTLVKTGQADGVVVLDVGGAGVTLGAIRPFLLQALRANPESLYEVGVLDSSKEEVAAKAMKAAEMGVVLVVEGWSLSGPQMTRVYERIRELLGEKRNIRFLVVGTVKGDEISEVDEGEMAEWVKFVDTLRDPAVEAFKWEASAGIGSA